ncbi:MAG: methionine--tRNA ligase subunit beta [Candidatus Pacebacteria bacterium]|nr:methionine--tRNA ligase subunit beta [Candidatus Paceibacterota bacterium]
METVSLDYFKKLDLRVAEILEAERVPETDKLLKLKINLGDETREIVSGIGAQYKPEDLIGKQIVVLANLEPKIFKGIESQGMLLAAVNETGEIALLKPNKKMKPGDRVQ